MTVQDGRAVRLEKARELIDSRSYVVAAGCVYVYSDSPGVAGYEVAGGRCSCPDATVGAAHRLGIACKHGEVARAVLLAREIIERQPERARQIAEVA